VRVGGAGFLESFKDSSVTYRMVIGKSKYSDDYLNIDGKTFEQGNAHNPGMKPKLRSESSLWKRLIQLLQE
jgi:hypothetical protein